MWRGGLKVRESAMLIPLPGCPEGALFQHVWSFGTFPRKDRKSFDLLRTPDDPQASIHGFMGL